MLISPASLPVVDRCQIDVTSVDLYVDVRTLTDFYVIVVACLTLTIDTNS